MFRSFAYPCLPLFLLYASAACSAGDTPTEPVAEAPRPPDPTAPPPLVLHEWVRDHPGRILHGWGQSMDRWASEAVPYFEAVSPMPVVFSAYVDLPEVLTDPGELDQIGAIVAGWTDPETQETFPLIPLLGLAANPRPFHVQGELVARGYFVELGITDAMRETYDLGEPSFGVGLFAVLADEPELWASVRDTLVERGYPVAELDLAALVDRAAAGDEGALVELTRLRDRILEGSNLRLLESGAGRFGDLEVLAGDYDAELDALAAEIAAQDGPVLMYESIGGIHRASIFSAATFRQAYRYVAERLRAGGAERTEFVFHPVSGLEEILEDWYPGDDVVDWVGGSLFGDPREELVRTESAFARDRGKPYLLAESAPTAPEYRPGVPDPTLWERWYGPWAELLRTDANLSLFVYINIDWTHSLFPSWGNTRVQDDAALLTRYEEELARAEYVHNRELWESVR